VSPDSKPSAKIGADGSINIAAVSSQGPALVTVTKYHRLKYGLTTMLEVT